MKNLCSRKLNNRSGSRNLVFTLILSLALFFGQGSTTSAFSMRVFKNCKEINSKYVFGVAASVDRAGSMYGIVEVAPRVYKKYQRFDFDNDGLLCEDEELQRTRDFQSTSTTSTLGVTTTTVLLRTPPAGNWDGDLLYSSKPLSYGGWYMFGLCTSGSPNSALKLWVNVNGEFIQKAESFPLASHDWCTDSSFPVFHRFYWAIDWMGASVSSGVYKLDMKVTGLKTDALLSRYIVSRSPQSQVSPGMSPAEAASLALKIACIFGKVKC